MELRTAHIEGAERDPAARVGRYGDDGPAISLHPPRQEQTKPGVVQIYFLDAPGSVHIPFAVSTQPRQRPDHGAGL